nr:MAG TPA: baseplate protein [Caudoviricetes sp.]
MSNFVNLLDVVYPVGSIYQSMSVASPASIIGGTWTQLKTFLYGSTTAKQTGGEATHTLTVNEIPAHAHSVSINLQHVDGPVTSAESLTSGLQQGGRRRYGDTTSVNGGGASTQQLAAIHDLLHLVPNSLNLSEVAYV